MPSYMLGNYLATLVSVHFPGGRLGFAKAGGDAMVVQVPGSKDLVYILVPEETTKDLDLVPFREALEKAMDAQRAVVRWVSSSVFEGTLMEVKDRFMDTVMEIAHLNLDITFSTNAAVFGIAMSKGTKEDAEKILDIIGKHGVMRRAVVLMRLGYMEREYDIKVKEEATPVIEASTSRDRVISKDEVTDLTILLENAQTVEDFLKSI